MEDIGSPLPISPGVGDQAIAEETGDGRGSQPGDGGFDGGDVGFDGGDRGDGGDGGGSQPGLGRHPAADTIDSLDWRKSLGSVQV